jgi:hypothetical protein
MVYNTSKRIFVPFWEVDMSIYYQRYCQGEYQLVYRELVALQERVFEPEVYEDALCVAHEMMRRIRQNIQTLIERLPQLGYVFESQLRELTIASELAYYQPYRLPSPDTSVVLEKIEATYGTLPLVLRCFYEEVGSVNFLGTFSATDEHPSGRSYGLDALVIEPLLTEVTSWRFEELELEEPDGQHCWDIAPDADHKYETSGSGGYSISLPARSFDTRFNLINYYAKDPTFLNYLRTCFHYGGFYCVAWQDRSVLTLADPWFAPDHEPIYNGFRDQTPMLTPEELAFLRTGMLDF